MIRLSRVRSRTGEMEKKSDLAFVLCKWPQSLFQLSELCSLYSRGCTDIVCCILFILAILGYIAVGILGKETALYFC